MSRTHDGRNAKCRGCSECVVITLTALSILISLILIAIGAVALCMQLIVSQYSGLLSFANATGTIAPLLSAVQIQLFNPFGIGFVVVGSVSLTMSILGCCAAIKHNFVSMVVYGVFIGLVAITLIVTVVLFSTLQSAILSWLANYWQQTFVSRYYIDVPVFQKSAQFNDIQNLVGLSTNLMMSSMSCCGINNYTDMQGSAVWNRTYVISVSSQTCYALVPPVCCQNASLATTFSSPLIEDQICSCIKNPTAQNSFINNPCFPSLIGSNYYSTYVGQYLPILVDVWAALAGLFSLVFICTIFLMVLYHRRGRQHDTGRTRKARRRAERNNYDRPLTALNDISSVNPAFAETPSNLFVPPATSLSFGVNAPPTNSEPHNPESYPYKLPRF